MATTVNSIPTTQNLSNNLPAKWCLNVYSDGAITAQIIKQAEPTKRHWIDSLIVTCYEKEWWKILDGDNPLIGPITGLEGQTWLYRFLRAVHASEDSPLKIQTETAQKIHFLIEGQTDAYTQLTYTPTPEDVTTGVAISPVLTWSSPDFIVSHDVYLGTSWNSVRGATINSPEFRMTTANRAYAPGTLPYSTTHYWRIDASDGANKVMGKIWSFTTIAQ